MADAYGYVRLSVNRDGEKEGCDRQRDDIAAMAKRNGDRLVEIFEDDNLSAWRRRVRRPGFEALFDRVKGHDQAARRIYVWRLDRFLRQPFDLERFIDAADHGVRVHSFGGGQRDINNADDRFILRIETAAACRESDGTSRRVTRWAESVAERGRPASGKRPFGYRHLTRALSPIGELTLAQIPAEADVIREIFALYIEGRSRVAIAELLQRRVVDTAMGRTAGAPKPARCSRWSMQQVSAVLRSPTVAGLRAHVVRVVPAEGEQYDRTDLYPGNWRAIVDVETWEVVQAKLSADPRVSEPTPGLYLLSGLVYCAACGAQMSTASPSKNHVRGYRCQKARKPGACGRMRVSSAAVDRLVGGWLAALVADPDALRPGEGVDVVKARAQETAERARAKLREIAEDYAADRITREERDVSSGLPRARLREAEKVLAERVPSVLAITGGKLWDALDADQRRAVARACLREVRISATSRRGPVFDTSRVDPEWR